MSNNDRHGYTIVTKDLVDRIKAKGWKYQGATLNQTHLGNGYVGKRYLIWHPVTGPHVIRDASGNLRRPDEV